MQYNEMRQFLEIDKLNKDSKRFQEISMIHRTIFGATHI